MINTIAAAPANMLSFNLMTAQLDRGFTLIGMLEYWNIGKMDFAIAVGLMARRMRNDKLRSGRYPYH
jgi:hypothetical protein